MKQALIFVPSLIAVIMIASWALGIPNTIPANGLAQMSRACIPQIGAATTIDCSNVAAASSAILKLDTRYMITCTDASYLRWGTTAPDAASGDMILPNGAWLDFATDTETRYVSCLNINADRACYILECK